MKANFFTIILSFIITIASFIGSLLIELCCEPFSHSEYVINILIGVFASGILLLVSSVIGYKSCKNEYYLNVSSELISVIDIISEFNEELTNHTCQSTSKYISAIFSKLDNIKLQFMNTIGFRKSKRDKIIESIIVELFRYLLMLNELGNLNNKLKKHILSEKQYQTDFDVIVKEMDGFYNNKLKFLKDKLLNLTNKSIKSKSMNSILDK